MFKLVITLMTMILAPKSFACSVSEPGFGIDWFSSIGSFYFFSKKKKKHLLCWENLLTGYDFIS